MTSPLPPHLRPEQLLGRRPQFDERSRAYPVRRLLGTEPKLRSYTWRVGLDLDQSPAGGACTGFSGGLRLAARPRRTTGVTYDTAVALYFGGQRRDPWPGGAYPGASPYYEGGSVLAVAQEAQSWGVLSGYHWGFGVWDVALGIGHHGPGILGINWYERMFYPDDRGFLAVEGDLAGGHAILAPAVWVRRGVRYGQKLSRGDLVFTLKQTWGTWGVTSRLGETNVCYVDGVDVDRLLREDGECCFYDRSKLKVVPSVTG